MMELKNVLKYYDIEWKQVTSIFIGQLCCHEREEGWTWSASEKGKPHLLDISGHTVHIVANSARAMLSLFKSEIENLCSDLFYDNEKSQKQHRIAECTGAAQAPCAGSGEI